MTTEVDTLQDALTFHSAGELDRAEERYRRILAREPENPRLLSLAYNNMAVILQNQGRRSQAVEYYRKAARLAPDCAEIHFNLANALRGESRLDEAAVSYERALEIRPEYAEAHNNLAITLREQGKFEQAIDCYINAIQHNPGCAFFHSNLASLLQHQGRVDEAISHCEQAVGLDPESPEARYNLGSALRDAGRCDEAIIQNDLAIQLRADYAEAHWNQAIAYLLKGNFKEGWREYEWRRKTDWHISAYPHKHEKPRWNGKSFAGKRLLVHCEQGLGDSIQFVRYLPLVKARGGTVLLEAWKSLHGLFAAFDGIDELLELSFNSKTQAQFDAHVSVMDLPGLLETTEQTIPDSVPYIHACPIKSAQWSRELAGRDLKVGIVWAGSARHGNDRNRSCGLEYFLPLSQIDGVRLYGLQKGEAARQAAETPLTNLGEQFDDFTDAAAAIDNLDLVISVDTAVLHLAGAMGKPVWALLAFAPDWRWMLEREDSPWYPTMWLFRQQKWGDWACLLQVVARELRTLVYERKQDLI
jgi:Tfp pilus assembly protein PilF